MAKQATGDEFALALYEWLTEYLVERGIIEDITDEEEPEPDEPDDDADEPDTDDGDEDEADDDEPDEDDEDAIEERRAELSGMTKAQLKVALEEAGLTLADVKGKPLDKVVQAIIDAESEETGDDDDLDIEGLMDDDEDDTEPPAKPAKKTAAKAATRKTSTGTRLRATRK
jgi:hypothetical protein